MTNYSIIPNFPASDIFKITRNDRKMQFQTSQLKETESNQRHEMEKPGLLSQLQNQREQIARDLHDGIGSQLTHIISRLDIMAFNYKGMENQLTALRDFTSETVQQLRETIWVLNQCEITYGQLTERIRGLLSRISTDSDYPKMKITSYGDGNLELPPQLASSIFRIVQESVNNAIKYAECTAILVCLARDENSLTLLINDNGKGFCPEKVQPGYGLLNIRRRAEELNGSMNMDSSCDGTNILVEFPI